ncbi:sugar ABC transporter substrate-binding protein [Rathayibacter sp. VKM Ac-2856]|uniref:ABC transporter substrate-binding protein n=1 Tax=unclassified Rathayibacter TaxID=2609250 RepID=UPI001565292C|nr:MULTISPECIES: sugar ABC transporter substrate-binding protein [unclassified Rathayibacter]NQX03209.1 sugar ABC transporter substrate-binding protein [Rathayibacter sp. VKM Ac-2858]NQX18377.1 sugar ABC transporter substrate-binding protein [Rathayibacter sp. VKM Ac-2856]
MNPTHRPFRRLAAAALAGAMALSLAACSASSSGGNADPAAGGAEGTDDGTTLTLWTRAPLEKQAKALVEAYNASHENQVDLTVVPNDDYVAKVGAAAGSDGLPDLFAADIVYMPNWTSQGLFQDISSNIDGLDFKDSINEGHLAAGTYEDKEYALPFVLDLSMLFWNKELFAEAGLDPEQGPTTLAEFAEDAKAIQALNKPDTYGTATGLNCGGCLVFTWFPTIWAGGDEVMNEEGTESLLASDTAKDVYSTWKDLWDSGAVLPSSQDEAGPTWTAGFTEGKVGLQFYPATLLASTPFDAGVSGIPGPDGGSSTFVGGDGIGISKDSEKSPQAWNFLNWMMSEDAQVGVLAKNNDVVSRSDLASNQYSELDPRLVTINEVASEGDTPFSTNFQQAFNAPSSPWLTLVRDAVLGDGSTVDDDNDAITSILGQ